MKPTPMVVARSALGAVLGACGLLGCLAGCAKLWRTPPNVGHVVAADLSPQHPACLQIKATNPPKAFLVTDEAGWKQFWGPGEEPPVVNFEKSMVLVAFGSMGSEGPGTLEVWVLKYREIEDVMAVTVKEHITGEWPLSVGYSRAYDMVTLPRTDKPVKVLWRYMWGKRDENTEVRARRWLPGTQGRPTGDWPGQMQQQGQQQQGQEQQGGWATPMQQPR